MMQTSSGKHHRHKESFFFLKLQKKYLLHQLSMRTYVDITARKGKWLFYSAGSLFCYLSCQLWLRSAILYGAEHFGE
jgi:hypothetical protein